MDQPVDLSCGKCIGCLLERSRQWAVRCVHEASLYDSNCFITLTYDEEHLPKGWSLDKEAFQKFMKRLRKRFGSGPRYFMCGEYGENFGRPHYHACLFNHDFPDKYHWRTSERGDRIYRSPILEALWPFGLSEIGEVTFESAAYVARYVMKKVTGDAAAEHYKRVDPRTGELFDIVPEFTTMSRRPGIGRPWLDKFMSDVYPSDFVVVRGVKMKPPKYYDSQYQILHPRPVTIEEVRESFKTGSISEEIVQARRYKAFLKREDNTPERLAVKEKVKRAVITQLKRKIDHG